MRHRTITFTLVCVIAAGMLAGCGKGEKLTHETGMNQMMDIMVDMVKILETVKDEASAKAVKPKIKAIAKKAEALGKKMEALGEPSKEEQEKLMGVMFGRLAEIGPKMQAVQMKIEGDPKIKVILEDVMKDIKMGMGGGN